MKYIIVSILLVSFITDPLRITRINRAKSQAREAFVEGNYKAAITHYRFLIDSMKVNEDELKLNLAHAYFQLNDTANAITVYGGLAGSKINVVRSKAELQLGVINYRKQKLEEALQNFKLALKADSDNHDARYNYELLKKKLDEKKKKEEEQKKDQKDQKDQNKDQKDQQNKDQKDQKDKDQKNKDEKNKDQQNKDQQQKKDQEKKEQEQKDKQSKEQQDKDKKEQEKKEQEQKEQEKKQRENVDQKKDKDDQKKPNPQLSEKLEQMKISEQKAKMILEAMKNQEIQYLQQNKRKATKPKDRNRPDW
jgi:DNA polymerase III gamma/tau subunit